MTGLEISIMKGVFFPLVFVAVVVVFGAVIASVMNRLNGTGDDLWAGKRCPRCGVSLPMVRMPTSMRQALKGGWTCAQCGCEIDRLGRPNADGQAATTPLRLPEAGAVYHYNGPSGSTQAPAAEIAAHVRATPGAKHLVWKDGMPTWADAASVPEIAALVAAGGPPPLPGRGTPPPLP